MADQDFEPTLGEVYRLCLDIKTGVNATNGRVTTCEREIAVLKDRDARANDSHARVVGYGSMALTVLSALWKGWRP